jgi:hypothetical protein
MFTILHALEMLVADLFKSRTRPTNGGRLGSPGSLNGDGGEAPDSGKPEPITHPRLYKIAHIIQNLQTGHC